MADEQQIMQMAAAQPQPGPESIGVTQFGVLGTSVEIVLMYGRSRPMLGPAGIAGMGVEWLGALSMNPVCAKQLVVGLSQALAAYEKSTGIAIPDIPPDNAVVSKKKSRK